MTQNVVDSDPSVGAALVTTIAKIHPAIIAVSAVLGAYQATPLLVEYLELSGSHHVALSGSVTAAQPTPTPKAEPEQPPRTEPAHGEAPQPVTLPTASPNDAPAPPVVVVSPGAAVQAATKAEIKPSTMRGRIFRLGPPPMRFDRGILASRGIAHLRHVMPVFHLVRRFGRF